MNNKIEIKNKLTKAAENLKKNNLQIAKEIYIEVLDLDSKNLSSLNNLGAIYFQLGDFKKSIILFQKIIEINPRDFNAHRNLRSAYLKLGDLENTYRHDVEFLKLKSKSLQTKANLKKLIPKISEKLQKQDYVPTFFDNVTRRQLSNDNYLDIDYCHIFENLQNSKENRFISYFDRLNISKSYSNKRMYDGLPFLTSQGTHSLFKWKNIPIFKSTFDLTIYMMIIEEVKPDIIIELGSGLGGSAIWLADISKSLGLNTHVYSLDINKPELTHSNVTFLKQNLNNTEELNKNTSWDQLKGKKILIEDAHVNLLNILNFFDKYLNKNDYLIIEDSISKDEQIKNFLYNKDEKFKSDQFYLDFFGTNITCCVDSIFKCF